MQTGVLVVCVIIVALSALWVMVKLTKAFAVIAVVALVSAAVGGYFYGVPYVEKQAPIWKAQVVDFCKSLVVTK